jgi:TonB family protein
MRTGTRSIVPRPEPILAADSSARAQEDSTNRKPLFLALALVVVLFGILLAVLYSRSNKTPEVTEATKAPVAESAPAPVTSTPVTPDSAKPPTTTRPQPSAGKVIRQVLPEVPRTAQNTIRGTIKVVVRVQVDPSGKVASATFKMRGSSAYFAKEALNAAKQWEFSAPQLDGQATASTWLLQFRFKRKGIQATPQRVKG